MTKKPQNNNLHPDMQTIVITSPEPLQDEAIICNSLFAHGLKWLHLRKPGAGKAVYEKFILETEVRYRNRIVLHEHYELAEHYHLHGIHLRSGMGDCYSQPTTLPAISISCHSVEEVKSLPFRPAYCFLSPVFDSISKLGYQSRFQPLPDLSGIDFPVIALGGITPEKIALCRRAGFSGIAVLGYIWENPDEALQRFIRLKTPEVMSIAGFDPSAGAGVSADLKTFESTGSYGLNVCSALTFQNEQAYSGTHWVGPEEIIRQCELLFDTHSPEYIKIGLIENFEVLDLLTGFLKQRQPDVKIIWDPILKASAGQVFHPDSGLSAQAILKEIFSRLYLITPNSEELREIFGPDCGLSELQAIRRSHGLNILWKGGHNEGADSSDCLVSPEGIHTFSVKRSPYTKHGTGCILSAAITSYLAQGLSLPTACSKAQVYVSGIIGSNDSLLGYHTLGYGMENFHPHPSGLNVQYITAPKPGITLCGQAEAVCRGGMRWIQLRMKGSSTEEMIREGIRMKEVCRRYHALFIINDRVEVARTLDADGVHLGKEDMDPREVRKILGPGKIIGATCNTWEDILLRQEQKVDYIGLGPFTFTTTKEKLSPVLGAEGYRRLLQQMREHHIDIPVYAIGGITEKDIPELMATGIQGIALSGLIKNSNDLTEKTEEIIELLNHKRNKS